MYAHKKTHPKVRSLWTDRLSFFSSGPSRFLIVVRLLTVRITLGHTLKKSTPVVLLVCMKSYQRSSCLCCSFRKADAKVVLLNIPTKQIGHFFPEFFVNKYNSLNLTTIQNRPKEASDKKKRGLGVLRGKMGKKGLDKRCSGTREKETDRHIKIW